MIEDLPPFDMPAPGAIAGELRKLAALVEAGILSRHELELQLHRLRRP